MGSITRINAFEMQRCIQRHGEIEHAWHVERDELTEKINLLDNLVSAWRVERRVAIRYLQRHGEIEHAWHVERDELTEKIYLLDNLVRAWRVERREAIRYLQRHGEIEHAWHVERDELTRKIYLLDNLVRAWRVERREAIRYLHEREIQMAEWSEDYLGTVGRLRRADIEARTRDGDRDVLIQLLHRQYTTRCDGRICRELRRKIQSVRRKWWDNTVEEQFSSSKDEFWGLPLLFTET